VNQQSGAPAALPDWLTVRIREYTAPAIFEEITRTPIAGTTWRTGWSYSELVIGQYLVGADIHRAVYDGKLRGSSQRYISIILRIREITLSGVDADGLLRSHAQFHEKSGIRDMIRENG